MRKDIRVSFKDNPDEDKLYDEIIEASKIIGKSAWLKLAAKEKLDRERKNNKLNPVQNTTIVNELSDLFQ